MSLWLDLRAPILAGASDVRTAIFAENFLQRATVSYSVSNCLTADGQKREQNQSLDDPPACCFWQQAAAARLVHGIASRLGIDAALRSDVLHG